MTEPREPETPPAEPAKQATPPPETPPAETPPPETPKPEAPSPPSIFLQFVVFPLGIVLVAVAIAGLFTWLSQDRRSYADYLNEIQNGWTAKRGQAAYELSYRIADAQDELKKTADVRRTLAVFEGARKGAAPEVRRYLAIALGHVGNADAVGPLVEATADEDLETRLNAAWALGRIHDRQAVPALVKLLDDPFDGLRKVAAFSLGELGDPGARDPLAAKLGDPSVDVRWNAALSLARLKDARALPVLLGMLDRTSLEALRPGADRLPMTDDQRDTVLVNAVRGVLELGAVEALAALDQLASADKSYRVRQAALEARETLRRHAPPK